VIVIPMAGNSSRFYKAGYQRPKYELPVGGDTLFALCVNSFAAYFASERFVFVCRQGLDAEDFVRRECGRLGVRNAQCVTLQGATRGQAETVLLGLQEAGAHPAEAMLIFNIDTVRPGYRFPPACNYADGYLEVFSGEGEHWSFVRPAAAFGNRVAETTEKRRISNLCCSGLYHFARAADYVDLCAGAIADLDNYCARWGELYVAPLYNAMIAGGAAVSYHEVPREQVIFSGTPEEYRDLLMSAAARPVFWEA
jgi:hypothetical protein